MSDTNPDNDPAFKVGPDYLNEAFKEAGIEDMKMSKTPEGQLRLDSGELSVEEVINRLISGIAKLYSKLFAARRTWG